MNLTAEQKDRLYACARQAGELGDAMVRSLSGADKADSEVYFCERRVYVAVSQGVEVDAALAAEDARWRAYAAEQAAKVDAAPKIKRGPMRGHSAIHHRWVNPGLFKCREGHIRIMIRHALDNTWSCSRCGQPVKRGEECGRHG